ncbi:MAG TPA: 4-hydroxy-tetrahydrodipicolinate synthase [Candidatus Saccharimonadales bacterium]|nr:4-hydroxy-tetrahydrodipicolinate synthase [Candidatus Saccharimonadales bacterium]
MDKDINKYRVWTAIITPMNDDGTIDYASFEKILKRQESAGNAITILGSTGEALNLDEAEKKQILDFVLQLKLSVPLMAGVGGINLNTQLEWIKYLNTLELDCYLPVVPLYAKPGVHGQYGWFKALLDTADKPCMLYNVPGRTAKNLELETVSMLKDHKNFWAIKEASGSEKEFAKYAKAAPNAHMMSGDDAMLPAFSKLGAKGVVSVAANVWPEATDLIAGQCIKGVFKDTSLWRTATEALFCASNPVPVKALMHDLGQIDSPKLRLPLSDQDMPKLDIVRRANSSIEKWLASAKKS